MDNPLLKLDNLIVRADSIIDATSKELSLPVGINDSEIQSQHFDESFTTVSRRLLMELTIDYWNGAYKPIEHYESLFPTINVHTAIESLTARLDTNGLPPFELGDPIRRDEPNPEFVIACNIICDFSDKRGTASKLKDIGKTTRHWNAWLNKKANRDYLASRMDRVWDENLETNAKLSIGRLVESGDLQAIKFYYEVTHKYRPQDAQIANLQMMMVTLMEVLSKYVTSEVLSKIADEIDHREMGVLNAPG